MKQIVVLFLSLLALSPQAWSQTTAAPAGEDIDSVFSGDNGAGKSGQTETGTQGEDSDLISDVLKKPGIDIGASFSLVAGYSPGLNLLPWDVADPSQILFMDKAILKFDASLSFNARVSRELRFFLSIHGAFPELAPEFAELFCDYSMLDAVYIRIGRQNVAWGISPNYRFTDLLARLPDGLADPKSKSADSYAFKMTIPVGIGGFDAVLFTRNTFWDAPDAPTVDEIGGGGKYNLALDNFDFSIGGFYHKDLNLRFFYSLKTTLPLDVEAYTEGVVAFDTNNTASPGDKPVAFSANAGIYFDLFDRNLKVNAEYFYNGEESELDVKAATFPLLAGQNVALNLSWSFAGGAFKLLFKGEYNFTQDTGILIPAASLDVIPHCTFSLGLPWAIGSTSGGYMTQYDDNDNRRIAVVFAIIISGKI